MKTRFFTSRPIKMRFSQRLHFGSTVSNSPPAGTTYSSHYQGPLRNCHPAAATKISPRVAGVAFPKNGTRRWRCGGNKSGHGKAVPSPTGLSGALWTSMASRAHPCGAPAVEIYVGLGVVVLYVFVAFALDFALQASIADRRLESVVTGH